MKDTIAIYHAPCRDGFAAAFSAWLVLGDTADYVPASFGEPPPDATGKTVYILDFSYSPEVLAGIDSQCKELILLDHPQTAYEALGKYQCRCGKLHFDMSKSGARLAWEHFHPEVAVPLLIESVEDFDLELFKHGDRTYHFLAALDRHQYSFKHWATVLNMQPLSTEKFLADGKILHEKFRGQCRSMASRAWTFRFQGQQGLIVNTQFQFASDVGRMLADASGTFGLVFFFESADIVKVSLRSQGPFEVHRMAQAMGGGGHPLSASFRLPVAKLGDLVAGRL